MEDSMFSVKNTTSNFFIFLIVCSFAIIGCGPDGGGNNNGEDVDILDAGFGAGGVLAVNAQGQEIISAEQDAKNIAAQDRNEQKRRELLFTNRFNDLTLRQNAPFRAAGDDIFNAVDFNATPNKVAYAGISDEAVTKVMFALSDTNGVLDVAFGGGDGIAAIDAGAAAIGDIIINGVVLQDDGKITAVGTILQAGNQNVLAVQVNADGTADTTFGGGDGIATFDDLENAGGAQQDQGNSAVLSGGNIVIGRSSTFDGNQFRAGILIIDNTGAQVNSFTSGADNSTCLSATVDTAGNLIGVGARAAGSQVFKLNAAGVLDNAFGGGDGILDVAGTDFVSVVTDANDNIVISGQDQATTDTFLVRRLGADGAIDPTFNGGANLVFEPKVGGTNQAGFDVFLRGTEIVVIGGAAAAGDILGYVAILNDAGTVVSVFESTGLIDDDVINEDFKEGFVDPNTNRVIAVGQAIEDGLATFDGVAVRIID